MIRAGLLLLCAALTVAKKLEYKVLNEFPRDPLYTQGLFYDGSGILYDSNGLYGKSSTRKTELLTGKVLAAGPSPRPNIFAEGCVKWEGKIFQLTWKAQQIFVYNATTMDLLEVVPNPTQSEGWGITYDGTYFVVSDGSNTLWYLNPSTLAVEKTLRVTLPSGEELGNLNELEYMEGFIWANIYPTSWIAVINPSTSVAEHLLNLNDLHTKQKASGNRGAEVVNGIAAYYDGRVLVSGKMWDKIYEISVDMPTSRPLAITSPPTPPPSYGRLPLKAPEPDYGRTDCTWEDAFLGDNWTDTPVDQDGVRAAACDGTLTAVPVYTHPMQYYTAGFMCCPGQGEVVQAEDMKTCKKLPKGFRLPKTCPKKKRLGFSVSSEDKCVVVRGCPKDARRARKQARLFKTIKACRVFLAKKC